MSDDIDTMYENEVFPSFLSISTNLKKRKKYKKIELRGMVYVIEDVDSEYEDINPYDMFPNILNQFLNIEDNCILEELRGKLHTVNYNLDIKLQHKLGDAIVKFANEYGLLGLAVENRSQKYLKYEIKPETDYKSDMMGAVFVAPYVERDDKYSALRIGDSCGRPSRAVIEYGKKPMNVQENRLKDYNESVIGFMYELDNIYRHRKNIEIFKKPDKNGKKFTEDSLFITEFQKNIKAGTKWKDYFEGVMNDYTGHNLYSMSLEFEHGSFKLKNDCKTLLSALILMSFQDIVNRNQQIRFCENPKCGRAYIVNSKKQRFDTSSCGTYMRVNKLRGRELK